MRISTGKRAQTRHLPDIEQWNQSSGSNVIPRRAHPGLAGLRPHRHRKDYVSRRRYFVLVKQNRAVSSQRIKMILRERQQVHEPLELEHKLNRLDLPRPIRLNSYELK